MNNFDTHTELERAIIALNEMTRKLFELSKRSSINSSYQIEYAKVFIEHKKTKSEDGKYPSDELAKQMTIADARMQSLIEEHETVKFEHDIYNEVSRNLRKKIDSLKGTIQENYASNNY